MHLINQSPLPRMEKVSLRQASFQGRRVLGNSGRAGNSVKNKIPIVLKKTDLRRRARSPLFGSNANR